MWKLWSTKQKKVIKKRELSNPIIDNRIISDYTFATRFSQFLEGVQVNCQMDEEELEYMKSVASKLLVYHMATVNDKDEKDYFKNLGYKL